MFTPNVHEVICMICSILGYDSDKTVDSIILGFLRAIFPPTTRMMARFYIAQFISESIHEQLKDFPLNKAFCFQSYLVYLLLFQRKNDFHSLYLETENEVGELASVIHWTPLVRSKPQNVGFSVYVNSFMSIVYTLFHEQSPPRIFPEIKKLLHESSETQLGDWFLFKEHTEIRMYGAEVKPFKLPSFLTMRIFSLEFIRQSLNVDEVHFIPRRKKTNFKPKREIGPFIVHSRSTLQVLETMLQELGLEQGTTWQYDPLGVINNKRLELDISTYKHQSKPDLEQIRNLDTWEEIQNFLQGQIQKETQSTQEVNIDTPLQQEKALKRSHNWELQDDLETKKGQSSKKSRTEVIIDDGPEEEAQPETGTLEKIQKEVAYSIDTLPSIFMKPPGEGSTDIKPQSVFSKYDDMKNKNEQIKNFGAKS
jgi:hypothetical protein